MYFLKRLIMMVPLLVVISFLAFGLVHLAPGGPFDRERKPASPEIERAIKAKFHLDEPFFKQYARYFGLVWEKGKDGHWHRAPPSFDTSLQYRNHSVRDLIAQGLPVSMALGCLGFFFALGTGVPIGFYGAVRKGRWQDYGSSLMAIMAVCIPGLVIAPFLIMLFTLKWRLLPVGLWGLPLPAAVPTVALGLLFS